MSERLENATLVDIILSIILPAWGLIIGLIALCKGEKMRAATMIAISTSMLFLGILALFLSNL